MSFRIYGKNHIPNSENTDQPVIEAVRKEMSHVSDVSSPASEDIQKKVEEAPEPDSPAPGETAQAAVNFENILDQLAIANATIRRQQETISSLIAELSRNSALPLINNIIGYIDTIQEILKTQDSKFCNYPLHDCYIQLSADIEQLQAVMTSHLENINIFQFSDVDENPVEQSRRQMVCESQESSNENEFTFYGTAVTSFYRTCRPGYVMINPDFNSSTGLPEEIVIRPERIIRIVYHETTGE